MGLKKGEPVLAVLLIGAGFLLCLGVGFYSRLFSGTPLKTPPQQETAGAALAVASNSNDQAVLAEFRWNRDRERSRLQETLEKMLRTAEGEQITKVQDELLVLLKRQTLERELENLLAAKGYLLNAVAVYPEAVTVIIKQETLNPVLVAEIGELVTRITGYRAEQVRIME
ncbi:MAG TPA: SpoIIIAH-like family protein [Firmicutes bacterium]|nr:SpoIIIAH-like family protein [Bacillota bacterium]